MTPAKPARPELEAEQCGFNNGRPVRLIRRVSVSPTGDVWRVQPLFVEGPERADTFRPGDTFKALHGC